MNTLNNNNSSKRANFTATFDRYETDELYEAKLHLKDVKNNTGVIVKSRYWLKARDARDILGKLMPDEEVSFSAVLEVASDPNYAEGFKLLDPVVLTKK
jgi:hypothetical protein